MESGKRHYLELGIEFCLELAVGLYQLGAEEMDLPHNFIIGILLWVAATALAVRMFWIFPHVENWPVWAKTMVSALAVILLIVLTWSPISNAYHGQKTSEIRRPDVNKAPHSSIQQNSKGNNSPNINVPGNNNKVTVVIGREDPRWKKIEGQLTELIKKDNYLTPKKLLLSYPLGYAIYTATYEQEVFPNQTRGALSNWKINWYAVKCTRHITTRGEILSVIAPEVYVVTKPHGSILLSGNWSNLPAKAGTTWNIALIGGIEMQGKVLEVNNNGVVFMIGMKKITPQSQP